MAPPTLEAHALALPTPLLRAPAALPEVATRAMERFSCTGAACEDTCCQDFGITIDRASLGRMHAATARDPEQREKIVRLLVLGMPAAPGGEAQSLVELDERGACPMLERDGRCGVHERHGEAALSTTCSVFPRTSLAVADRLEITGTLACPEMARLTLLSRDGLVQEPSPRPLLSRPYVGKVVDVDAGSGYEAPFLRVRETLSRLFGRDDYPLGSRLVFAANLAAQVDEFFRRDTAAFTGAGAPFARKRLDRELAGAESDGLLANLHGDLQAFAGGGEAVVGAAATFLAERRRLPHPPRFAAMLDAAFASLQAEALGSADRDLTITPAQLLGAYRRRRDGLDARWPGLADTLLGRYCRHHLLRVPYTDAPSLMAYLGRLSLSLAAIRLLWLGTPAVAERLAAPDDDDAAKAGPNAAAVERAAVSAIQIFTKTVSHHLDYLRAFDPRSEDAGGTSFGRLVLFAKVV